MTVDKTELAWHEKVTLTFTLKEGYSKLTGFEVKVNGTSVTLDSNGKFTVTNAEEDITFTVEGVADNTAPTGEITLGTNSWKTFLNNITFGLVFKDAQKVTITANDKGSGVDKIYYYLSTTELIEAQVKALSSEWNISVISRISKQLPKTIAVKSEYGMTKKTENSL